MPRVTIDDMVRALRESDKPLTASGIGEATGISMQAVAKRRDELESDGRVAYGKVGGATAYWIADHAREDADGGADSADTGRDPPQPKDPVEPRPQTATSESERGNGWGIRRLLEDVTNNLATITFVATVALLLEIFVVDLPYVGVFFLYMTVFAGIISTLIMMLLLYSDLPTKAERPVENLARRVNRIVAIAALAARRAV